MTRPNRDEVTSRPGHLAYKVLAQPNLSLHAFRVIA